MGWGRSLATKDPLTATRDWLDPALERTVRDTGTKKSRGQECRVVDGGQQTPNTKQTFSITATALPTTVLYNTSYYEYCIHIAQEKEAKAATNTLGQLTQQSNTKSKSNHQQTKSVA